MKISRTKFGIIMSMMVGLIMSLILSFIMLFANTGLIEGFFLIWMKSFALSFILATPIAMIAIPAIEKLLLNLFEIQKTA